MQRQFAGLVSVAFIAFIGFVIIAAVPVFAEDPDGKALYESKCAMCHGKDGLPKSFVKGAASFVDPGWQKAHSEHDIVAVLGTGKNKMPNFTGRLNPQEMKAVAAYVKSFAR